MNGYERRTKLKRDKIRTAALELFCRYGADKTTVNDIAQKAGVSPATIYNYFGSKEGLFRETIINFLESNWKIRKELWESNLPFPEILRRALSMKDEFIDQVNVEHLGPLLNGDPEVRQLIEDFYKRRYPDVVRKFIEKGRREGYIRKDISIEAATLYLRTIYQNAVQQPEILESRNKDLLNELYDLMLYGLAGQPIVDQAE